jgi:hypothetical protein
MQTFFLWFPPDFFPALLLGLVSGSGFKLWKYAKGSCLLMPIFWYVYGAWLFSCFIVLFGNPPMLNGFFVGLGLAFAPAILQGLGRVYARYQEFQDERHYRRRQREQQQEQKKTRQEQEKQQQEHAERTRREREAEAERERQQRRKQQENTQSNQNQEQPKPPPQKEESDTRTPEQVLGLGSGWTQDDLLKAYRRESQRLHPGKWTGKPQVIREAMEREFKRVQEAYKKLLG